MGLDIRWPIGLMFSLIGLLLTIFGAVNRAASSVKVEGQDTDINLIWGIVLLVFGVLMLLGAMNGRKNPPSA
jgi:hypothetical protein